MSDEFHQWAHLKVRDYGDNMIKFAVCGGIPADTSMATLGASMIYNGSRLIAESAGATDEEGAKFLADLEAVCVQFSKRFSDEKEARSTDDPGPGNPADDPAPT